ncbi:hypothetical protein [Nafulsella turpanensis]|uniref:hypothetical protein n=1 Tax=Nafulsella turpanensis TaxID=1265690 RepID=UPI00034706EF|nr:hypothetical protein [Nafulsella turpanensis]
MRKLILAIFSCLLAVTLMPEQALAQREIAYETSAGVRLSAFYGASIKHFFEDRNAVEGILHSSWGALKVTGLYERHMPAFDEPGLRFYYGGGGHIGFTGSRYYDRRYDSDGSGVLIGIDGILGAEYTIQDREIPLNVSLDWKPVFEFTPFAGFWGAELGLTVRYIFRY